MRPKFKPFSFLFSFISIIICLINYFGYDGKDYILFFTSPPLWIIKLGVLEDSFGNLEEMPRIVRYILSITFWSLVGEKIDKNRQKNEDF